MGNVSQQPLERRGLVGIPIHDIGIYSSLTMFLVGLFFSDILPASGAIRTVSAWLCLCFSFFRTLYDRSEVKIASTFWIWVVFLLYILVNKGLGLFEGAGLKWLLTFVPIFFSFLFLRDDYERWVMFVVKAVAVMAVVHAVATIVFFIVPNLYSGFFYPRFMRGRYVNRMGYKAGITGHYSTNGMYLAHGLIANWSMAQLETKGRRYWRILFVIIFVALLLTTKRAHLVFGLASCSLVYLMAQPGQTLGRIGKLLLIAIGISVIVVALSSVVPELLDVLGRLKVVTDDDTFGGRADYYKICLDMWRRSPVLGLGWATFPQERLISGLAKVQRAMLRGAGLIQNAHNVYLQLLGEEGLVGLFIFLGAAYNGLACSLFHVRCEDASPRLRLMYAWAIGAQVFFLLYCVTGNPLYDIYEYAPYLVACSAAFTRDRTHASERNSVRYPRPVRS